MHPKTIEARRSSPAARAKRFAMENDGLQKIGDIFVKPDTGDRATLDYHGRVQWFSLDDSGQMTRHTSADTDASRLQSEIDDLRRDLERHHDLIARLAECDALIDVWRNAAIQRVPEAYISRCLERKYLNGDNAAAGWHDCADDLAALLRPVPKT